MSYDIFHPPWRIPVKTAYIPTRMFRQDATPAGFAQIQSQDQ